jgi:CRISPR-associated protein Csb2
MTTIELRFPAKRYHANPWGRHVNEGVAEWPPSPYRFLRALYDVWRRKRPDLNEEQVVTVLRALAEEPPAFQLPTAVSSHTRGYLSSNSLDPNEKSLIFDAFVAFARGSACYITWPATLKNREVETLAALLSGINYLGRSESWAEASLASAAAPGLHRCIPADRADFNGDLVQVTCPVPDAAYSGKRSWIDALAYSSSDLIKERRSSPPAMRTLPYIRAQRAVVSYVPAGSTRPAADISAVVLSIDGRVLPLATATLEVADQIRTRLMGIYRAIRGGDPTELTSMFSGRDQSGEPLTTHGQIFILPQSNEVHRIDRILIFTKARFFDGDELNSIFRLRELWQSSDPRGLRCVTTWQGRSEEESLRPGATHVISATPFVTSRHRKKRQTEGDFLDAEIRRECHNHNLPAPVAIRRIAKPRGMFESIQYRRNRKQDPSRPGYAFAMDFAEPVRAPFALGYGCHFGLGQFIGSS